ncbi:unnamed protein product, partial [Chrysoparadoxa australica]
LALVAVGLVFLSWFFIYETNSTSAKRSLATEVPLAAVSSFTLGFGTLFCLLWAGLYV